MALPFAPALLRVKQGAYWRYLKNKCVINMVQPTGGVGVINGSGTTQDDVTFLRFIPQLMIRCTTVAGGKVEKMVPVTTAGTYTFALTGVPAGVWTVVARCSEGFGGPSKTGAATVTVT